MEDEAPVSRGTSRKVAIIILIVLMLILGALALIIAVRLGSRSDVEVAVEGESCATAGASQCQLASVGGNTGNVCTCVASANGNVWNCGTFDALLCPRSDGSSTSPTVTSTTTSAAACTITTENGDAGYISIAESCPEDFFYVVRKTYAPAAAGTTSEQCQTILNGTAENITLLPSDNLQIEAEVCGRCVSYEMLSVPQGTAPNEGGYIAYGYSGECPASTTTSSSETSASTPASTTSSVASTTTTSSSEISTTTSVASSSTSSASGTLPDTALFDHDSTPLLLGIMLILGGLLLNRLADTYEFVYTTKKEQKISDFEEKVAKKLQDN